MDVALSNLTSGAGLRRSVRVQGLHERILHAAAMAHSEPRPGAGLFVAAVARGRGLGWERPPVQH